MLKKKGSFALIGGLIFLILTFSLTPANSASINERDARLIEIAYMNGFIAALKLDEKTTAELRKDKEALKRIVIYQSKAYLDAVRGLNKQLKRGVNYEGNNGGISTCMNPASHIPRHYARLGNVILTFLEGFEI